MSRRALALVGVIGVLAIAGSLEECPNTGTWRRNHSQLTVGRKRLVEHGKRDRSMRVGAAIGWRTE